MYSSPRIVLIDDEPDILELLRYNLSRTGAFIDAFLSPEKAWTHILQHRPDVIVSDWMMPEMDGITLCRQVQATPEIRHIPVIILTCRNTDCDKQTASEAGASDFLTKPVRLHELSDRIKRLSTRA